MKAHAKPEVADGLTRFMMPLNSLHELISNGKGKRNPALYFYQSDARNHLFKLEALCRIYKSIKSKKIFDPLLVTIKKLEDQLGRIDHYNQYLRDFSSQKNIPASFIRYFMERNDEELKKLNDQIRDGNLLSGTDRYEELKAVLSKVKWDDPLVEKRKVIEYICGQIDKFIQQYENGSLNFNSIENGVHEFRRKLRWISIYAQSLNGLISLKKTKLVPEGIQQYLTPDIISSPFNILPPTPRGMKPAEIQAPFFYALSWIIQETGRLKDAGLRIQVITDGLKHSGLRKKETMADLKNRLIPGNGITLREIPEHMEPLADRFIYGNRVLALIRRDLQRSKFA